jgi:hypothetical protein
MPMLIECPSGASKRGHGAIAASGLVCVLLLVFLPAANAAGGKARPHGAATTSNQSSALVLNPSASVQTVQSGLQLEPPSADVSYMTDWVAATGDNAGMPYVIIDKVNARVFVLDARGHLQGTAPALLGMVHGDGSIAGIGDMKLSAIRPDERTTPAGRYVASLGRDLHGQDILWIDYANALALHRVVKGTPAERRAQRLQSRTSEDNRISYGCINVPVKFYDDIVRPAFTGTSGVVYILPEMSSVRDLFKRRASGPQVTAATIQAAIGPAVVAPAR